LFTNNENIFKKPPKLFGFKTPPSIPKPIQYFVELVFIYIVRNILPYRTQTTKILSTINSSAHTNTNKEMEMEGTLSETPTITQNPANPWGKPSPWSKPVQTTPCSLEDVMSEQLAGELQQKENSDECREQALIAG